MKLYLLGAANPETLRMLAAVQRSMPNLQVGGFIDNDPDKVGTLFYGHPVLGGIEQVPALAADPDAAFVNLITGSSRARYETGRALVQAGARLTNFIHPNVDLTMTSLGVGNYIQEAVILQAGVSVGDNSSLHMAAIVGHESSIGHSVFIAHAVSISGCCRIGDGCFIGTNATILPRVTIGRWATVGAGAVVTRDVPDCAVVVGNPGRVIKTIELPYTDGRVA
jgi:sugar O-acyltransferase (sialic acid O-acetyltransferase NeuD family)